MESGERNPRFTVGRVSVWGGHGQPRGTQGKLAETACECYGIMQQQIEDWQSHSGQSPDQFLYTAP